MPRNNSATYARRDAGRCTVPIVIMLPITMIVAMVAGVTLGWLVPVGWAVPYGKPYFCTILGFLGLIISVEAILGWKWRAQRDRRRKSSQSVLERQAAPRKGDEQAARWRHTIAA